MHKKLSDIHLKKLGDAKQSFNRNICFTALQLRKLGVINRAPFRDLVDAQMGSLPTAPDSSSKSPCEQRISARLTQIIFIQQLREALTRSILIRPESSLRRNGCL
jgi:hypothetical protein